MIRKFIAAGAVMAAYLTSSFLPLSDSVKDYAKLSPSHYYLSSDPLIDGLNWGHAGTLTALAAGLFAISIPLFERRDLKG